MKDLYQLGVPFWDLALRCAVIYLVMIIGLRAFGKREVGQFTLFDLVLVLLIANAVQPAMTGPDSSLLGGVIIIATLLILNLVISRLREESPFFRRLIQARATVIAQGGSWLPDALRREGLELDECDAALREHGLSDVSETKLAVLETDGTISVVPIDSPTLHGKRRVRYHHRNV